MSLNFFHKKTETTQKTRCLRIAKKRLWKIKKGEISIDLNKYFKAVFLPCLDIAKCKEMYEYAPDFNTLLYSKSLLLINLFENK